MSNSEVLERLFQVIQSRRGGDADSSYTASLFAKGPEKITQKVGEEAVETIIAALRQGPDAVASESADLLYHLLVLWAETGVAPDQVWAKLAEREGTSGLEEKRNRKESGQ